MDFTDKIVMITGGAGCLATSFAEAFLEKKSKVFLADINLENLKIEADKLSSKYGNENVGYGKCDVTKDEDFENVFDECEKQLGTIDILMNHAGIGNGQEFSKCIDINLNGTLRGSELIVKRMGKHHGGKGGHIINTASVAGLTPYFVAPFYSAAKGGIIQYTRSVGHKFHYDYTGIMVQCICPSLADTPFLKYNREWSYNDQTLQFYHNTSPDFPKLTPKEVTDCVFKLIADGRLGGTLVLIKGKEPFYLEAPIPSLV